MTYQPYYSGNTYPAWDFLLTTDSGAENLAGVSANNLTMIFRNTSVTPPVDTVGTGTFTIKVANPAEVLYQPSVADVAYPFSGQLILRCDFPPSFGTSNQAIYDPITFVITAS